MFKLVSEKTALPKNKVTVRNNKSLKSIAVKSGFGGRSEGEKLVEKVEDEYVVNVDEIDGKKVEFKQFIYRKKNGNDCIWSKIEIAVLSIIEDTLSLIFKDNDNKMYRSDLNIDDDCLYCCKDDIAGGQYGFFEIELQFN